MSFLSKINDKMVSVRTSPLSIIDVLTPFCVCKLKKKKWTKIELSWALIYFLSKRGAKWSIEFVTVKILIDSW